MHLPVTRLYRVVIPLLCSAFFLSATWLPAGQGSITAPPAPGTLVDVGGYRLHLYCTGTGTPTVMIVGAAFSFDWGLVQPVPIDQPEIIVAAIHEMVDSRRAANVEGSPSASRK